MKVTKQKIPEDKKDYKPTDLKIRMAYQKKMHLALGGWHNNYADFKQGKHKGTIVFVGSTLGVSIDQLHSFSFDVQDIVNFCLEKVKKSKKVKAKP